MIIASSFVEKCILLKWMNHTVRSNGYGGQHKLNIRPIMSIGQQRRLEGHAIDGVAGDVSFAVQQVTPPALHIKLIRATD